MVAAGRSSGSLVVAIGSADLVAGFGLAGVRVHVAADARAARRAWTGLGTDVAVVILTPEAARAVGEERLAAAGALAVVMP